MAAAGTNKTDPANAQLHELEFTLPAPEGQTHLRYLGLEAGTSFTPDRIKADILIIEIFSMYCPICQREAPKVNTLYERITKIKEKSVRLMGIGAGNSDFETQYFQKTYGIEFPLFSDGKFIIHKKVGEKGTPYFIGLKPNAPKGSRIFFTHSGEIKDLDAFIGRLLKAAE
ncbi:MAG: TlpA family protein disulfide reductase [Desulfobacter sp.]|nr:MAG: TlpA family protein disulfide reductase [Desulfobacter sp.]